MFINILYKYFIVLILITDFFITRPAQTYGNFYGFMVFIKLAKFWICMYRSRPSKQMPPSITYSFLRYTS